MKKLYLKKDIIDLQTIAERKNEKRVLAITVSGKLELKRKKRGRNYQNPPQTGSL